MVKTEAKRQTRYQKVVDRLVSQIDASIFLPDTRLPSVRDLMKSEKISLTTATRVFQELEATGRAYSRNRSGYFVQSQSKSNESKTNARSQQRKSFKAVTVAVNHLVVDMLERSSQENIVALGSAVLNGDLVPQSLLNRVLMSIAKNKEINHGSYVPPPGLLELRCNIARIMVERGVVCSPDDILITAGDSIATEFALRAVTRPGDSIAIETPTYFGILQAIETSGLKAIEISTSPETGIDLDELKRAVHARKISCVLLNPTIQNPLGYTMPLQHRHALVELLAQENIPLIEDDVFHDLYDGVENLKAIKSFDHRGMVLYCSSFSKVLTPGYRIGWCIPGKYRNEMLCDILARNISISSLPQVLLSEFIRKGYYGPHTKKLRELFSSYPKKIATLIERHFPAKTKVSQPTGGFVFWIELPAPINIDSLYETALANSISITPGTIFSTSDTTNRNFRICVGRRWTSQVEQAIIQLGALCKQFLAE
ncbi:MAG TPA: PLP-dependent aminotransferase family protein [Noviherbaspirillum sp.]|nr:PLP-dependent aminotransferase family protein [Noviherbaspirillum sp.]